ncbi:MarR family winged helix-turn-helix transcriptional regulator [Lichenihabitans sp. PAMC28606]|uniref:MarR family winged helix-turn-helix transcriptional regulator n=1 Tax=Lichenihabitans sp. PAMC28606 TaxID=2880932 RepID=UPI0039B4AA3B
MILSDDPARPSGSRETPNADSGSPSDIDDLERVGVTGQASLLLGDQICFAVYALAHAFSRRYKPHLDEIGITYPQYVCLLVLWETDGLTVKAIGERLLLDSGTLTPLLKRLEAAGLVSRRRDRIDERQVRVSLTEAGQALRERCRPIRTGMICATGLPFDELDALKTKLVTLRETLDQPPS